MMQKAHSNFSYPIELYMPRIWAIFSIPFGIIIFLITRAEVFTGADAELVPKIFGTLGMLIAVFMIISGIVMLFNRSPLLSIRATGFSQFNIFKGGKEIRYYWRDIEAIELSYIKSKSVKTWYLKAQTKEGKVLRIIIKSLYHKDNLLEVHDIYRLMQTSFSNYKQRHD